MKIVSPDDFISKPHWDWSQGWYLLTSGDYEKGDFNSMLVAWGFFGTMWFKPAATVVVRPGRFTFEFMEKYDTFTLSALDKDIYDDKLQVFGKKSGRDINKFEETGLTPVASASIASPSIKEASVNIQCRKLYWDDFKPENFMSPSIDRYYPEKDYHRMYIGEITKIVEY